MVFEKNNDIQKIKKDLRKKDADQSLFTTGGLQK